MLAIAAQLAAGARRVYAVDETGKIVWVVSQVTMLNAALDIAAGCIWRLLTALVCWLQERFAAFLDIEQKMFQSQVPHTQPLLLPDDGQPDGAPCA